MSEVAVSVVIPVYNEAPRIGATLKRFVEYLRPRGRFELIVVDDGSVDGTAAAVQARAAQHPEITLVQSPTNRGKGAAVREGVLRASGRVLCFCDADLPIPNSDIDQLLTQLQDGCDVAIASRALSGSVVALRPRLSRRCLSWGFNRLVRTAFRIPFRDTQCGFKGFRRVAAQAIFSRATIDGFAFDVELLLLARRLGFSIGEFPVRYENAVESSVSIRAHGGQICRDLWRIHRHVASRNCSSSDPKTGEAARPGNPSSCQSVSAFVERQNAASSVEARLLRERHPALSSAVLRCRLGLRPLTLFWKSYIAAQGWREGMRGLVFGLLMAWAEFLTWAKWWESGLSRLHPEPLLTPPAGRLPRFERHAEARERLTVVILTKNEEGKIARCLERVRWADEVVVVDGLSTDRTVEICRGFGATVVLHPFEGSFAMDRNLGLSRATGDWVLQIDADDLVTPEFQDAAEAMLRSRCLHAALRFYRRSVLLGRVMRHGGWRYTVPNLVRRTKVSYVGLVHERPEIEGTIGELPADIEHHPCENLTAFVARHNRYTSLQAAELFHRCGRLPNRAIAWQLWRRPWKVFWKSYVKKEGFREELHGLVFALFYAGVELLKWAKYWELTLQSTAPQAEPMAPSPIR